MSLPTPALHRMMSTETRDIERRANDAEPFSGLAFKIMNDPFVGSLTFVRIYSGILRKGRQPA